MRNFLNRIRLSGLVIAAVVWGAGPLSAGLVDLSGLQHGEILNTQVSGVTISASNIGGGADLAAIFNTSLTGTADPDLQGPGGTAWTGGNLGDAFPNLVVGNAIILAENAFGAGDGILDNPDDEGSRPAGTITFAFDQSIDSIGFDLIDIETISAGKAFASIGFHDGMGGSVLIPFNAMLTRVFPILGTPTWDGDNSINRILPFTAYELGLSRISVVDFNLGGSSAITNIQTTVSVPDVVPTTLCLAILSGGMFLLGFMRRRTGES